MSDKTKYQQFLESVGVTAKVKELLEGDNDKDIKDVVNLANQACKLLKQAESKLDKIKAVEVSFDDAIDAITFVISEIKQDYDI